MSLRVPPGAAASPNTIKTVIARNKVTKWWAKPRWDEWHKPRNTKDCANGYHVVQAPCFELDGTTSVKSYVKGNLIGCPLLSEFTCPYTTSTGGKNQKCVACVQSWWGYASCNVRTRFVDCG